VSSTNSLSVLATAVGQFRVVLPFTFLVTNTNDAGTGSLRHAILDANASVGTPDTILFDTTFFNTSMKTITLATVLPNVSESVTITGPGSALATVNVASKGRGLDTTTSAANSLVTISGLTITGASVAASGAGILVGDEILELNDVTVTGNSGSTGAGIYVGTGGGLKLVNSTISSNIGTGNGGGLRFSAGLTNSLTITGSKIINNSTSGIGSPVTPHHRRHSVVVQFTLPVERAQRSRLPTRLFPETVLRAAMVAAPCTPGAVRSR
jgi:hypothetical protein